jgi:competence protein ComEC
MAATLLILLAGAGAAAAEEAAPQAKPLAIVFVDVEGGAATLIVTPAGESVLIDAGFPGERDAGRIQAAAGRMGLTRIDHFILTHWHLDHVGGIGPLSEKMPVERFYDRGLPPAPNDGGTDLQAVETYKKVAKGKEKVLSPGDEIPLRAASGGPPLNLRCLVARSLLEGGAEEAKDSPACREHPAHAADPTDNAKSLGFLLRFGDFKFLDLGDLSWNIEHTLVCPSNRIGKVDVYQVTHHGADSSNNPVVLQAASPRVAVMDNGPRKGGIKSVYASLKALSGLEAIFQLHRNVETGEADNAPRHFIANWEESCTGEPIAITVAPDARTYSVQVGRSGLRQSFQTR